MTTQVYKHKSVDGLASSNIIYDKEALALSLDGHANADEIMAVLGMSVDREDNGFRNCKAEDVEAIGHGVSSVDSGDRPSATDDPLNQLISEESGTSQIVDHLTFYLGDNRAWRNGWNAKSFQRHVRKTAKGRSDNGVVWGAFSMIPTAEEKAKKAEKAATVQAEMAAKKAKRLAKLAARHG